MLVKKHVRPNPQRNVKGGIAEQESPISISNVQLRVRDLWAGAHRARVARRRQGAGLQEVRNHVG